MGGSSVCCTRGCAGSMMAGGALKSTGIDALSLAGHAVRNCSTSSEGATRKGGGWATATGTAGAERRTSQAGSTSSGPQSRLSKKLCPHTASHCGARRVGVDGATSGIPAMLAVRAQSMETPPLGVEGTGVQALAAPSCPSPGVEALAAPSCPSPGIEALAAPSCPSPVSPVNFHGGDPSSPGPMAVCVCYAVDMAGCQTF